MPTLLPLCRKSKQARVAAHLSLGGRIKAGGRHTWGPAAQRCSEKPAKGQLERKTPRPRPRSPAGWRPGQGGDVATGQPQMFQVLEVREGGARAGHVK